MNNLLRHLSDLWVAITFSESGEHDAAMGILNIQACDDIPYQVIETI
jgi:hypothetical protein